jgi:GTP-binding protein
MKKYRNIAVIAHVDHGKTTLVDELLGQSGVFGDHGERQERVMDSMDIEKERGITIAAKNASFEYEGVKINIVDTPGHGDFGGEVERVLNMVDGALLLVDAAEGPLPQTRFVLKKALEQDKKIIVVLNKVDRKDSRAEEVLSEIEDLFMELATEEDQLNFEVVYAIARDGKASKDLDKVESTDNVRCIYDLILSEIPEPKTEEGPFRMLVSDIQYSHFVGRLAVGRVLSGEVKVGDPMKRFMENGKIGQFRVSSVSTFVGAETASVDNLYAGDIAILSGFENIDIGDTLSDTSVETPVTRITIDEPTVGLFLSVNDGPFAGLEGKEVTSRKILERLETECMKNVSIRLQLTERADTFQLIGRGELQLAVIMETFRRDNFEFMISQPQVVMKEVDGQKHEPIETVYIDVQTDYTGIVTQKLQERKGIVTSMVNRESGRSQLQFEIPSRGLIGYGSQFLTDTRGTGLLSTEFKEYAPFKGEIKKRQNGRLTSDRKGKATSYSLFNLEDRGTMFIEAGVEVYQGMIIGEYNKAGELNVNVCREKKLTNVRASGTDEAVKLTRVRKLTLEQALEWIVDDELIELTPKSIRLRRRKLEMH